MRLALVAGSIAVAATAAAAPRPASWADWVGDYHGKLRWSGCTAPGARQATLALDAIDGVLAIDLRPAGRALGTWILVDEPGALEAQQADVTVRITRSTPRRIALAIDYESGCTVRGELARTTAMAGTACDQLAGWKRIAARCTKAELAVPTTTRQCALDRDRLALAVIDAGCAPAPVLALGTECPAMASEANRLARCGRAPSNVVDAARQLAAAAQTATAATQPVVEARCRDLRQVLARVRCP